MRNNYLKLDLKGEEHGEGQEITGIIYRRHIR
jgi:hypothetical protein